MKHLASFLGLVVSRALLTALAILPPGLAAEPAPPVPFPFSELGAKATANYEGDAIGITAKADGAQLLTAFQKLSGSVTREGLWLASTEPGGGRLRLIATAIGRSDLFDFIPQPPISLPATGAVVAGEKVVVFTRPGLREEYSVSVDGVRQDLVVVERLKGSGDLLVELTLTGARAEAAAYGAKLTFDGSGRELAYSRLRVVDATGQELAATLEVLSTDRLAVRVTDATAAYPIRIDPTFSDADWVSLNPGLPGAENEVYAIATDGSGNVYIGGAFTVIGTMKASRIAKWDGSTWSALGPGLDSFVYALAVNGSDLYAGGDFTAAGVLTVNHIAKWNGTTWSKLGSGMDSAVRSLLVSGTDLYAGGDFTFVPPASANRIAKWNLNTSTWSAVGSGMNNSVRALAVIGPDLFAGGTFTMAGGSPANYIAKWNGTAWSALGSGMTAFVNALTVIDTNLYAGGEFLFAGGVSVNNIAKWDGSAWSALGSGVSGNVYALAVSGTNLYAGGAFATASGVAVSRITKWDGSAWSALGSGIAVSPVEHNYVKALAIVGTDLYAGGGFATMGGVTAKHVAKWNGSNWSALGSGMNKTVRALAVIGTDLYAGGYFSMASGVVANYIAKWNGSTWSPLGSGISGNLPDSSVKALAVIGTNLYAGGDFTVAGGLSATNIAKWDGSAWSALGSGVGVGSSALNVRAMAVSGTNLYVGGQFSTAGAVSTPGVAKWNGSTWSALGSGIAGPVLALAVSDTNLYAGGGVGGVAKWDGNTWSSLGSGLSLFNTVYALAVSDTNLYVGGHFSTAGGVTVNNIAKWNGSAWSALGSGMFLDVYALAVDGTNLYAGGQFTTAGGVTANHIAKWDGIAWSPLGSGIGGNASGDFDGSTTINVFSLVAASGRLFVGGLFGFAGTNLSPYIVQANVGGIPPVGLPLRIFLTSPNTAVVAWPAPSTGWTLQQNTDLDVPTGWVNPTETITVVGGENQIIVSPLASRRYYRLAHP